MAWFWNLGYWIIPLVAVATLLVAGAALLLYGWRSDRRRRVIRRAAETVGAAERDELENQLVTVCEKVEASWKEVGRARAYLAEVEADPSLAGKIDTARADLADAKAKVSGFEGQRRAAEIRLKSAFPGDYPFLRG